ncbi:MAG: hypothetical protein FJZ64_02865 [Chlamydiae bacterium]|nr:hypothetical protein [Chlamydiota bacterium]
MNRLRELWWVFGFCVVTLSLFVYFMSHKRSELQALSQQLKAMKEEKMIAMQEREYLELQIASQKDPSWIEMILMRDLGVVPEGWLKVHFVSR